MAETSPQLLEHEVGIYSRLSERIDARLASASADSRFDQLLSGVLEKLRETVSDDVYAEVQRHFTADGVIKENRFASKIPVEQHRQLLKYLDIVYWLEAKLRVAWHLGLHKQSGHAVLDIGTGCGHFAFACKCLGHEVLGTDLPNRPGFEILQMFEQVCGLLGVPRVSHEVRANGRFPTLGKKFDIAAALMANFSVDSDGEPWSAADWRFLLTDLRDNVVVPGGVIYFSIGGYRLSPAAWDYLVSIADWVHPTSKQVRISSKLADV
jgi:hypothetical protein